MPTPPRGIGNLLQRPPGLTLRPARTLPDFSRNDFGAGLANPSELGGLLELRDDIPNCASNSAIRVNVTTRAALNSAFSAVNCSYDGCAAPGSDTRKIQPRPEPEHTQNDPTRPSTQPTTRPAQMTYPVTPHDLILKAVEANTDQKWILLYVQRWLVAPMQLPDGSLQARDRGTPQGSAVSPCLANLFLHYAFDAWMARTWPSVQFERYVDDAVVHCVSQRQADLVLASIAERMAEVGLELHPTKTKVVYCRDSNRRGEQDHISFDFLGYTFRARAAVNKRTNQEFSSFAPAISRDKLIDKGRELRSWRMHRHVNDDLADLAEWINPIVRGWMTYWGHFHRAQMYGLLQRINAYLMRWACKKYRRLRSRKRLRVWWADLVARAPKLFAHWGWVRDCGLAFAGR